MRRERVGAVLLTLLATVAVTAMVATSAHTAPTRTIHVDDGAVVGGNGSGGSPYNNLADALADARTTSAE